MCQKWRHGSLIRLKNGEKQRYQLQLSFTNCLAELKCLYQIFIIALIILQRREHVQHLILVSSAGFTCESFGKTEWLFRFRTTWKGANAKHLWESNCTPQKLAAKASGNLCLK
ncbi:hypothetical protein MLD38_001813 [Melastoma candidum]|uniref:Uncharacterized protein n=1 Tax=Melastoma candidum TaxID=119954 RepID=A0ACB9SEV1_9MYRT|nr:hypothetical protein MLD38_001813 [Melastoma candidum]